MGRGGLSTRLDGGGVNIMAAAEKRVKYCRTLFWVMHDIFYSSCQEETIQTAVSAPHLISFLCEN